MYFFTEATPETAQPWQVPQPSQSSVLMKENKWDRVQAEHQAVAGAQTSFSFLCSARTATKDNVAGECEQASTSVLHQQSYF